MAAEKRGARRRWEGSLIDVVMVPCGDLEAAEDRTGDCGGGTKGEEVRRLIASTAIVETESDAVRVCEADITEVLTDRGMVVLLERIRDLGGVGGDKDERGENEDRDTGVGELRSLAYFPDGLLGELVPLDGGEAVPAVRDVDVA